MSRLVLYGAAASPPARSVVMLANLLGLKYELRLVNLLKWEHRTPEYLKVNPMGTVPALADGDFILSESHAIMKYLVGTYGGEHREQLYPTEPRTRAVIDQCLFFNAELFFPTPKAIGIDTFLHNLKEATPKQKAKIENGYSIVEAYLQSRPYIATDHLSIADLAAGATATAAQCIVPVDKDKYPKCKDWVSRLEEEKCFKDTEQMVILFRKMLRKFWEKNKL